MKEWGERFYMDMVMMFPPKVMGQSCCIRYKAEIVEAGFDFKRIGP